MKQQQDFMDKMVNLVVWLNSAFALIVLGIFAVTQVEPETLIKYWFASFTGELLAMAAIKITKNWKKGGVEEDADYRDQPQI